MVIGARHLERQRARLRALAQEGAPPTQCALARQLDRAALGGQRPEEVIFSIFFLDRAALGSLRPEEVI